MAQILHHLERKKKLDKIINLSLNWWSPDFFQRYLNRYHVLKGQLHFCRAHLRSGYLWIGLSALMDLMI